MTDKERLESLKRNKEWTEATGEKFYTVDKMDYEWLIEQAELVGYFARKNGELNEFLNKYIEPKHLGKNVIDVAMDIIVKQSERAQELEQQNKNYRKAIKECVERMNAGGAGTRSFVYKKLIETLEGE